MSITDSTQSSITDRAHLSRQMDHPKLNPYPSNSPEHAEYEVGWSGLHLIAAPVPTANATVLGEQINQMLGYAAPEPGSKSNGWFGGYGCRWCSASRAWFATLPFEALSLSYTLADLFREAGCKTVTVSNSGGVSKEAGGLGIQVSAWI
jgi:hypothetical protein